MDKNALHKQKLFWAIISTPIIIGFILLIPTFCEYDFYWSSSALVNFYDISKLQFSIMLLSIPLGALTARIHATIQKEEEFAYKKSEKENTDDEKILEQISSFIEFIKHELTTKKIDKNRNERWIPINNNIGWIRAAKDLIRVINLKKEITHHKNKQRCDDDIERLHLHLYRYLRNDQEYLPLHFFTGSESWKQDNKYYLINQDNSDEVNSKKLQEYVYKHKGDHSLSYRSDPNSLAPRLINNTIQSAAINCIFDFISLYVEPFIAGKNPKDLFINNAHKNTSLSGWPSWDCSSDGLHEYEATQSEGAAKYLHFCNKVKSLDT